MIANHPPPATLPSYDLQPHPDVDPPVPGHPCRFSPAKVTPHSSKNFTGQTGPAYPAPSAPPPSEEQMAAFLHHNGPLTHGIASSVFALRIPGCEKDQSCFITKNMCAKLDPALPIDHAITIVGYGTAGPGDPVAPGEDYWLIKNSWSAAFGNAGFIKVARGVGCAHVDGSTGALFTYGDASGYYEQVEGGGNEAEEVWI